MAIGRTETVAPGRDFRDFFLRHKSPLFQQESLKHGVSGVSGGIRETEKNLPGASYEVPEAAAGTKKYKKIRFS